MKLTHATKTLLAGLTLVSALALTACNGDSGATEAKPADTKPSGSAPTGSASSAPSGGGTGAAPTDAATATGGSGTGDGKSSSGAGGSTSGSGSGGTSAGICRSDELEVSAVDNTTDKVEGIVTVQLKNGGGRDCTVRGFAGVDLKTAAGDTLSVARNGDKPPAGVLKDGESAAFNISFPLNTSGGSGVRISTILVTPPNETKTISLKWPAGSLPVDNPDSPSRPLQITPVGKVSGSPAG
ncbi:DUF4232 domain-containing protein [Streptomyces sp. NPDC056470]|uniref:DUF4232 domain-containing protein n=1 Tax=Streptomyces sp. NPDC056470 TaxID=3345831 RepID=UPI00367DDA95